VEWQFIRSRFVGTWLARVELIRARELELAERSQGP
jgi:hypothetical protein